MARIDHIAFNFTLLELAAIHKALGRMAGKDYSNEAENAAGSEVYHKITPYVDDDAG